MFQLLGLFFGQRYEIKSLLHICFKVSIQMGCVISDMEVYD